MDQCAARAARELREQRIPGFPVPARAFDFDELMIVERPDGLLGDRVGEAGIAEPDHGLEGMGQAAQMAALVIGEVERSRHPRDSTTEMAKRSKSSGRWLHEHFSDPFVQRAQAQGWRSRAVFKLEEIDLREKMLRPGAICLDLGAAPGAWSQYIRRRLGKTGRVVATDLLPMEPLADVEFVQGDFREEEVFERILALMPQRQVDWVLSDMAPSMSGVDAVDQPRSMYLAELALDMTVRVLKGGGGALIKVFHGAGFDALLREARGRFAKVKLVKPAASRARSPEAYLLAKDFRLV